MYGVPGNRVVEYVWTVCRERNVAKDFRFWVAVLGHEGSLKFVSHKITQQTVTRYYI